jgi:hypothetical protein
MIEAAVRKNGGLFIKALVEISALRQNLADIVARAGCRPCRFHIEEVGLLFAHDLA